MRRYTFTDGAGTLRELEAHDFPRAMTAAGSFELRRSGSTEAAERAAETVLPLTVPDYFEFTMLGSDGKVRPALGPPGGEAT